MLTGATIHEIEAAIRNEWPAADPQSLLDKVELQIGEAADADPAQVRGWCFHAARDLYRRMVEIGDFAGALRAVKILHELTGQ